MLDKTKELNIETAGQACVEKESNSKKSPMINAILTFLTIFIFAIAKGNSSQHTTSFVPVNTEMVHYSIYADFSIKARTAFFKKVDIFISAKRKNVESMRYINFSYITKNSDDNGLFENSIEGSPKKGSFNFLEGHAFSDQAYVFSIDVVPEKLVKIRIMMLGEFSDIEKIDVYWNYNTKISNYFVIGVYAIVAASSALCCVYILVNIQKIGSKFILVNLLILTFLSFFASLPIAYVYVFHVIQILFMTFFKSFNTLIIQCGSQSNIMKTICICLFYAVYGVIRVLPVMLDKSYENMLSKLIVTSNVAYLIAVVADILMSVKTTKCVITDNTMIHIVIEMITCLITLKEETYAVFVELFDYMFSFIVSTTSIYIFLTIFIVVIYINGDYSGFQIINDSPNPTESNENPNELDIGVDKV